MLTDAESSTQGSTDGAVPGGAVDRFKDIVHEGNVRRIIIRSEAGEKIMELPVTVGVIGALLLPVWAAIGVIVALVMDASIAVERTQ